MLSKLSTGTSDNNSIDDPVLEVLGGILTSTNDDVRQHQKDVINLIVTKDCFVQLYARRMSLVDHRSNTD